MRMNVYLASSRFIDWQQPDVLSMAKKLSERKEGAEEIAKACFEFVRDQIKHSWDFQMNPVTCAASDVLKYGTGYCYAKSHLLAALLRVNAIPAGLCYQRLTITGDKPPFCLHGLNAVWLAQYGWYRIDARGNKDGVSAGFCPPVEKLAFPFVTSGEMDVPGIHAEPMPEIVRLLTESASVQDVANNLPDI